VPGAAIAHERGDALANGAAGRIPTNAVPVFEIEAMKQGVTPLEVQSSTQSPVV